MLRSSVSALVVPDGGRVADTRVARIIVRDRTEQWVQSPLGARLEVAVDRASSTRSAIDGRRPVESCGNVSSGAGPEAAAGDTRAPPYTGARAHRGKWVQTPRGARLEVAADLHRDKSRHGSCPYVTRVLVVITHQVGVVVGTDHPGLSMVKGAAEHRDQWVQPSRGARLGFAADLAEATRPTLTRRRRFVLFHVSPSRQTTDTGVEV